MGGGGWYMYSLTLHFSNTWDKEHIVAKNMADKIDEKDEVKELTEVGNKAKLSPAKLSWCLE